MSKPGSPSRRFMHVVSFGLVFSLLLLWMFSGRSVQPAPQDMADVEALLSRMTLEQKVGQMVMVGFPGTTAGPEVTRLIRQHHVGGVILFARNVQNPRQVAALNESLQKLAIAAGAGIPLFIATDQEGGIVTRLSAGVTPLPGGMALGATYSEAYAYELGRITAHDLSAVGINMNFAPVLDVNNNPDNPVIGLRSMGEDPDVVSRLGRRYMAGLQDGGVSATAKHFPGHGDTTTDSHIALPTINHSRERLDAVELVPFRGAIEAGIDAVMTAHITFPAVEPTPGLPATLSPAVLQGLLREELGFEGLIVTDAMEMAAIVNHFGKGDAAVRAVEAGVDIVLVAWPADWMDTVRAIDGILSAVRSGRISEARVDESVRRILQYKQKRGILAYDPDTAPRATADVGVAADKALAYRIARDAVTVIRNEGDLLPLSPHTAGQVLVIVPRLNDLTQAENRGTAQSSLGHVLRQKGLSVEELLVGTSPSLDDRVRILQAGQRADTIIVATYRATTQHATMVDEVRRLGKQLIVVALREPYDLRHFPRVPVYVATYGYMPMHMEGLAQVLLGETVSVGRLPVSIPQLYPAGHGLTIGGAGK